MKLCEVRHNTFGTLEKRVFISKAIIITLDRREKLFHANARLFLLELYTAIPTGTRYTIFTH